MSTPDQRARDHDRDAAIEVVQAAWADGQIIEADRDKRVEGLQRAQTLAEVRMLIHDLEPPMPAAEAEPPPAAAPEPEPVVEIRYAPSQPPVPPQQPAGQAPRSLLVIPLVIALVVVVAVVGGIVAFVGGVSDSVDDALDRGDVDVLSAGGFDDLRSAVEEETGSTEVFSAVLYPTYAAVDLPVDATTQREAYWHWDGRELTDNESRSTSSYARIDLSRVDGQVLVDLVARVKKLVDDPTTWYVIVRAPDDDRAMVWAYANNEYGEGAFLGARRDGTVTYDSTEH